MTQRTGEMMKDLKWGWELMKRRFSPGCILFEEGDVYCRLLQKCLPVDLADNASLPSTREFVCGISNCTLMFDSLIKYEAHYNSSHRHVCQICQKMYPSSHLLEVHILETHDVMFTLLAQKQSMCLLADCPGKFKTWKDRKNHMIKVHRYPPNYRYDRSKNTRSSKNAVARAKMDSMDRLEEMEADTVIPTPHDKVIQTQTDALSPAGTNTDIPTPGPDEMEADITPCVDVDDSAISAPVISAQQQIRHLTFSHRVPKEISFGHGVPKGFHGNRGRGRGKKQQQKKKHWHSNNQSDTRVDIESVSMKDLSDALS